MTKKEIVINYIKSKIISKEFEIGKTITPELILVKELNIGHSTIRMAINDLIKENILESRQGSGTYVKNSLVDNEKNIILILADFYAKESVHKSNRVFIEETQKEITKEGWTPYILYDDKSVSIHNVLKEKINKIAGCISIGGYDNTMEQIINANIPIVNLGLSIGYVYPGVIIDKTKLFAIERNLIAKYNFKDILIFGLTQALNRTHPNTLINYSVNEYFKKYNANYIPVYANKEVYEKSFKHAMKNLKSVPNLILFLDDNIYNICQPLFEKYDDILKQTKIITHSSGWIDIDDNYKTCTLNYDLKKGSVESVNLIIKLIKKEFIKNHLIYLTPYIVGEDNLK